jgi:hypothetical protein
MFADDIDLSLQKTGINQVQIIMNRSNFKTFPSLAIGQKKAKIGLAGFGF